jgi:hypothetical protein
MLNRRTALAMAATTLPALAVPTAVAAMGSPDAELLSWASNSMPLSATGKQRRGSTEKKRMCGKLHARRQGYLGLRWTRCPPKRSFTHVTRRVANYGIPKRRSTTLAWRPRTMNTVLASCGTTFTAVYIQYWA